VPYDQQRSIKAHVIDIAKPSAILERGVERGDVPFAIASAATPGGVIFEAAFDARDLDGGAAATTDTILRIASMSKAVTAVCAMQLVERQRFNLDEPIGNFLPELRKPQVLEGFDSNGEPRLRAAKRPITLRHLLTHTSGFAYTILDADLMRYQQTFGIPALDTRLNAALKLPLIFDPGDLWSYGTGIDWVGKAIEADTGETLGQYMKQNVLDPLGMTDTGFQIDDAQQQRLAKLYLRTDGGFTPIERASPSNPEFESGGAGLYSTIGDYLKFTQMILLGGTFHGQRILKPETVALMAQNAIGDVSVRPLKAATASPTNNVDFINGMKWGLSFLINPDPLPTGRSRGSLAWSGVMNCFYWIDFNRGVTGVFATQVLPFFDSRVVKLYDEFERAIYQELVG
jgi:methyl acetate hydrolase